MAAADRRAGQPTVAPRRALIVSAEIGEGHNAAGRALAEAASRAWSGCTVAWLDALDAVGPRFADLARWFYVTQVERTPRMYEFFFASMWRHRWYLEGVRQAMGALFGRAMAPRLRAERPDVVMSTYPLASAGLSWLRAHGRLPTPAGAWVPAFCPHPSWLYPNLDLTYVVHPVALELALRTEPGLPAAVGALPVRDEFAQADQGLARAALGLSRERFTAMVCTGSLGFGRVDSIVTAVLAARPDVQAVVVCGHNRRLHEQLSARVEPRGRLLVLGWTANMPTVMAAADVVVTNGGGGTALEALACGRPIVISDPVAGHGRANAELMAAAGLALLAQAPLELTAIVRRLADNPLLLAERAGLAIAAAAHRRREDDLLRLAEAAERQRVNGRRAVGPVSAAAGPLSPSETS
jgi:diacylglycerol O-acyltransferase